MVMRIYIIITYFSIRPMAMPFDVEQRTTWFSDGWSDTIPFQLLARGSVL